MSALASCVRDGGTRIRRNRLKAVVSPVLGVAGTSASVDGAAVVVVHQDVVKCNCSWENAFEKNLSSLSCRGGVAAFREGVETIVEELC